MVDRDPEAALATMFEAAEAGREVLDALEQAGDVLGRAIDDLIGAVNPHAVMLGGYLGVVSDHVMPRLRDRLTQRLAAPAYAGTEIMALAGLRPRRCRARCWPPATPASTTRWLSPGPLICALLAQSR